MTACKKFTHCVFARRQSGVELIDDTGDTLRHPQWVFAVLRVIRSRLRSPPPPIPPPAAASSPALGGTGVPFVCRILNNGILVIRVRIAFSRVHARCKTASRVCQSSRRPCKRMQKRHNPLVVARYRLRGQMVLRAAAVALSGALLPSDRAPSFTAVAAAPLSA